VYRSCLVYHIMSLIHEFPCVYIVIYEHHHVPNIPLPTSIYRIYVHNHVQYVRVSDHAPPPLRLPIEKQTLQETNAHERRPMTNTNKDQQKRPTKETCKRDLPSHSKTNNQYGQSPAKETYKRDPQKRPNFKLHVQKYIHHVPSSHCTLHVLLLFFFVPSPFCSFLVPTECTSFLLSFFLSFFLSFSCSHSVFIRHQSEFGRRKYIVSVKKLTTTRENGCF